MNSEHNHEWFVDGVIARCAICGTAQPVSPSEGEGEPFAWAWEQRNMGIWQTRMTTERPDDGPRVRNVVALYTHPASDQSDTERMRGALEPFAKEADNWDQSVPDDYRSLCTEPGSRTALPGSETAFTIGDLREARAALAEKAAGQ